MVFNLGNDSFKMGGLRKKVNYHYFVFLSLTLKLFRLAREGSQALAFVLHTSI